MTKNDTPKPNHSVSFFDIGEHVIRVEASYLTGKESVYVDDQLVSEKLTWRFSSEHNFELDGQAITVRIKVGNWLNWQVTITLLANDVEVDSDEWNMQRIMGIPGNSQRLWKTLLIIFLLGIVGGVVGYFVGYALGSAFKG